MAWRASILFVLFATAVVVCAMSSRPCTHDWWVSCVAQVCDDHLDTHRSAWGSSEPMVEDGRGDVLVTDECAPERADGECPAQLVASPNARHIPTEPDARPTLASGWSDPSRRIALAPKQSPPSSMT